MAQKTKKLTAKNYLAKQLKFLDQQRALHISKREDYQNLVYLNAQASFIKKMQDEVKFE